MGIAFNVLYSLQGSATGLQNNEGKVLCGASCQLLRTLDKCDVWRKPVQYKIINSLKLL
jgi:hypothetical protein